MCTLLTSCRSDAVALTQNEFGPGEGAIIADSFLCRGDEERLLDCYHQRPLEGTCSHFLDAGVQCSGEETHSGRACINISSILFSL